MTQCGPKYLMPMRPVFCSTSKIFTCRRYVTRQAITLVETTVVLLILSITLAAATPRLSEALQGYRLQSAAQRLLADLEMARSFAKVTGRDVSINIDLDKSRYTIAGIESLDIPGQQYDVDLAASPYYSYLAAASLSEASTTDGTDGTGELETTTGAAIELKFNRFEQASHDGDIELQCGTQSIILAIDAESGEVRLKW